MATGTRKRPTTRVRVLLVGDRFLLLEALRQAVDSSGTDVAIAPIDRGDIESAVSGFSPHVVVLDTTRLPIEASTRAVRSLAEPGTTIVCITHERASIEAARLVSAGAAGVVGLDSGLADFDNAIRSVRAGRSPLPLEHRYILEGLMRDHRTAEQRRWLPFDELSVREREIFGLIYQGMSADQIADEACLSINTVRSHIRSILAKLNVNSQLSAVALARSNDWFEANPAAI